MGTNRRYPSQPSPDVAGLVKARKQRIPITLTDAELDKTHQQPRAAETPIPVVAWIRYDDGPELTEAQAIAWTQKAVLVEWHTATGEASKCWVWASAVSRKK